MSSSIAKTRVATAISVRIRDEMLRVDLADGRQIAVPLDWYPRLQHATTRERNMWRLIGTGGGIHWPELDEDISIEGLLAGRASGESPKSLSKWLKQRERRG